ncbi:uncharacterized protein LOC131605388 [Vicia villosa]|uniref:uncharacterized protein LOC131605388 n=1 Tax=Vicia villosa TaxID=3911 RepID=UPI00273AA389|nr:uncharacterized protein LOC131605388 [Vicia villosa]
MASSSRNSSTLALRNNYDVFVSFRGEDTRYNFTDFLFDALQTKGIFAFRDDNNLPKGESIRPELLHAIQHSHIYVVVFSRNYASSTWCLQELESICECVQVSGKHILPVFYDVDPSDVRHQRGIYAEAFSKHEHRSQHDSQMVSRWREALTQVANLSGWDLRHKPQSVETKKIVQKIINILDCKSSSVSKDLVGVDSPIQELEKLLLLDSVDEVHVIGICGMGGIGKSSLATVLYDRISQQFGACCFIDDVSKIYRLHDGPLGAQKQILDQTLGEEHRQICNHYAATNLIRHRLCRQRALIILDNVGQVEQLEKIGVRREWLGAGSRIIIISRDEHILKHYGVDAVYQVPLLNWTNSLQLLCRKAFKLDHILSSYERLVYDILNYVDGLPLAINVLGSFLFGRDISDWKSALASLRENPDKDVTDVLRLSFDGLRKTEKEIFLHIACFFNKYMEKYVKNVLNCCEFHADIGLRILIDKSLVSIEDETIVMHNLLEELGRNIVAEYTSKERRRWRRLWFGKQIYDVMLENMEKNVEAIVLNHEHINEDMDAVIFEDFSNLRLLIINNEKVSGSLNCLSIELRYIEWNEYPFMYLPSSFQPNQLVELILKDSSIRQLWEGKKNLPKLKILDLSHSKNLIKLPNFGEFPNLERLNLEGCIKLVQLDPSIELLKKIVSLNLNGCKSLGSIPNNIFGLNSLKDLNMSGYCFRDFNNTRLLVMSEIAPRSQSTSSICKWTTKLYHSLFSTPTTNTVMFPSFHSLFFLHEVDISYCGLSQLPKAIECLCWLEMLSLGGNNFVTLPSLRKLSKLVYLNLENCKWLESLPELPFSTIEQDFQKNKYWRRGLFIFNCPKINDKEQCGRMTFSWMTQFIQVNNEYPAFFYVSIVIPGNEIPSWFNNQSVGHSIPVSPVMQDKDNNVVGLLCCALFYSAPHYPTIIGSSAKLKLSALNNTVHLPVIINGDLISVKSNHIWLIYFPWKSSYNDLYAPFHVETYIHPCFDVQVKRCGYRWVYKQDLQGFNSTMTHPEYMLALKRKFLAIEDEAQPQLHSFRWRQTTHVQEGQEESQQRRNIDLIFFSVVTQRNVSQMAMSSSSNSSSSALVTLPLRKNFDVFVSFRGPDTRFNFTDHLFAAFQSKEIIAFRDDNDLEEGESIGPELLRAIENSLIFVVVFSINYASSTWCLRELEKILQLSQLFGKQILPIFYDVDPSDVRHQKGSYAEAFSKHEQRFQQDSQMVQRWRETLTHVANLSGWDVRQKPQSAEIKKIVRKIIKILDCKSSCVSKDLVGMDSPIQKLEKLLLLDSVDDVRVIGICGMGGIGKTTLATVLYDRISQYFSACCFIDDVSKICRLHDGPLGVQKKILDQILGQENHQICNQSNAANLRRRRLCRQRVLMILDNVGQVDQLEKIAVHREWLGAGSRIIIISRDEHILKQYGVDAVYQVLLLDRTNSLQLLCRKAFKLDHILNSYEGLVNGILHYANGLPLAIKVLGSFLFGRDVSEWRSALARLRESPEKDVMDVLRLSFDDLRETEKEIFLHIACFFNKLREKYVKNVLNCCEFHADIGLRVLIDKSLVSIEDETIVMHNLLEELGISIVAENTSKEPRKWRKLWFDKQFYDVMLENMEKNVEALVLGHYHEDVDKDMDGVIIEDFSNLRLLIINKYVNLSRSLNRLSNELRYIEWSHYPFMYLPSSFQPNQLVELILMRSSIKQLWEGKKNLPKLRILDLSQSENLTKMPDFGEFPNLEWLNLEGCIKLVQLDPSIELLRKIVFLNLNYCESLVSIPNNIFGLSSLEDLKMSGCSRCCFKEFNNTRDLDISETASHSQPASSICKWTTKPYYSLFPTPTINTVMSRSLRSIYCLREVDISYCGLSQLPEAIGCLRWLEMLNLGGNNFVTLPSLSELSKLVYLNLENCKRLESLPELPFPTSVEQDLRKNKYLKGTGLFIFNCPKIRDKERCSRMTFSWMTQFIQVNKEYPAFFNIGIVIPGSEIPRLFKNQSVGSSIHVSPVMQDKGNNIVGFLCCVVFSFAPHYPTMTRSWSHLTLYALDNILCLPLFVNGDLITVKSNHIWLIYFSWKSSYDDLYAPFHVETDISGGLDVEVKKCGYRWVYKQDLQEFNSSRMHPKKMLALKRKFLAIEDDAQPQPHLHSSR